MKINFVAKLLLILLLALKSCALLACASQNSNVQRSSSKSNSAQTELSNNNLAASNSKNLNLGNLIAPRQINFQSPDKTEIFGTFYQSPENKAPAVLMLHQWGATRASFDEFAKKLQANGINALAIDGRGFGESIKQGDQKIVPSRSDESVAGMLLDVAAGLQFLEQQPNTDAERLGIVGASYGSSLAIIHAANNPKIKAVALLSPGINYFGNLAIGDPVQKYGARALLLVAAEDDTESAAAARRLDDLATRDKHQLKIFKSGGHGTALLEADLGLEPLLKEFFSNSLK